MSLQLLAVDLGKRPFHIHGIDIDGMIISRKTSRSERAHKAPRPSSHPLPTRRKGISAAGLLLRCYQKIRPLQ
jgi:hypothetical protein